MGRLLYLGVVCAALVACGGKKDEPGGAKDRRPDVPIRIAFSDCTDSPVPFVSGPRPLPPKAADAAPPATARTDVADTGFDDAHIYGRLLDDDGKDDGKDGARGDANGGSRYGALGHGPSVGDVDRSAGAPASVPTASLGQPSTTGALDKAVIRRIVRRSLPKVQYCYERRLLVNPRLAGTVAAQFVIAPSGSVQSATATGVDPEVASCVADVLKAIEFPRPRGGSVMVNYPFRFRSGNASGSDDSGAVAAASPPPPPGPPAPPPGPYQPGERDPLHQIHAELAACLRAATFGAMTVDLELDARTGQVTQATPGTTEAPLAACIAAAAKAIKLEAPGPTRQRCGFAYGEMPVAAVPTVAVTATDITFNGKVVDHPGNVVAESSSRIAALSEAFDAWQKSPNGAVPIRGPGLLEPIDATPMKVVTHALATAYAADADLVLAAQRGAQWEPLRSVALPVAPVPVGSGGTWSGIGRARGAPPASTDERVQMSVFVEKDRMWIGVSRISEFQEIPGRDWAKLEQGLTEYKASAFFEDRRDLEIAGADDVVYGDIVKTIDLVTKVGFSDWMVLPPAGLAARPQL